MAIIQEVRAVEVVAYKNYTVKTGETVWSIANKLDLNEDLNKTIYNIRKDNNIVDCGKLAEGQVIKIREVK
jgi:LysM repeat protein